MIWLLAATLLVPLAAVSLCSLRRAWRTRLPAFLPWAAVPGLALALLGTPRTHSQRRRRDLDPAFR